MTAVDQHLLLRALVDELAHQGTRNAVTCPGSRNTPIVEALIGDPDVRCWSQLDERSGGFFAVGAARALGLPVAVTVTSGTAVANLLPAVVEASEAGLPLIVLTADRPAELRQIGAGQTIDQMKIFGGYVRFMTELDVYEATAERMRWIRSLAARAALTATGENPGPVHLNIPLREPLVVDGPLPADPAGGEGRADRRQWVASPQRPLSYEPNPGRHEDVSLQPRRVVFVAGDFASGSVARAAGVNLGRVAARHGIPLLADPLSGARSGPAAIAHYDLILRDPVTAELLRPEIVVRIGELPTSKPLRAWLVALDGIPQIALHPRPVWPDPSSRMSVLSRFSSFGELPVHAQPAGWLEIWRTADRVVAEAIRDDLDSQSGLTEPRVAALLGAELPAEASLFVAASMPIRDVEEFVAVRETPPRFLANRGANGIDGTVSSAFGAAAVSTSQVVLLIGDVALLHDIGGLLSARRLGVKLTIVLINNDGGGIFNFLAIATHSAAFDEHVATPHGLEFSHAAALYGLAHVTPTDVGGFKAALSSALDGTASTIIEVRTDRADNRELHASVAASALARLRSVSDDDAAR